MDVHLTAALGGEEWWNHVRLYSPQVGQLTRARQAASRSNSGEAGLHDRIIAELSLGFWSGLVSNRYHDCLWRDILSFAFPYRPPDVRRGEIHSRLEELRLLRNRIAHHEPIFHCDLASDHGAVVQLLGYLAPAAAVWVESHSRVSAILRRRFECISGLATTSF